MEDMEIMNCEEIENEEAEEEIVEESEVSDGIGLTTFLLGGVVLGLGAAIGSGLGKLAGRGVRYAGQKYKDYRRKQAEATLAKLSDAENDETETIEVDFEEKE